MGGWQATFIRRYVRVMFDELTGAGTDPCADEHGTLLIVKAKNNPALTLIHVRTTKSLPIQVSLAEEALAYLVYHAHQGNSVTRVSISVLLPHGDAANGLMPRIGRCKRI
jgi:hypothetical protein